MEGVLGYPFWGPKRPDYCGHPKFELNCSGEAPVITINSTGYRVLGIDSREHFLTVARTDYWNDSCPQEHKNATLDSTFFDYTSETQDLTLYYRCSSAVSVGVSSQFSCPNDGTTVTNFFATDATKKLLSTYSPTCQESVVVRISDSEAGVIEEAVNALLQPNLTAALVSGFVMEWEANNSRCDECVKSDGVCGSNHTTGEFTCYCKDRPYKFMCGSDSVTPGSGIGAAVSGIVVFSIAIACYYKRENIRSTRIVIWKTNTRDQEFDVKAFIRNYEPLAPKRYSYATVKKMTKSFAERIGKGGYGTVYKGKLPDGSLVAVKLLNESKSNGEEFINEVASIGRTSHVNIVTLLGFCYERTNRALVYEYMPNGSLDKFIFTQESSSTNRHLEWKTLYEIAIGIARGLEYLHRGCNTRILHLDIKPQNILLDDGFCPKISDFGLAKLWLTKESIVSAAGARGTIGYIAPEVFSRAFGGVSHKSDVYSYGMLILEMVGGRKNFDSAASHTSEIYYPNRIYKDLEMENEESILGNIMDGENEISKKMLLVSFWCIQTNPADRPSMSKVVEMLEASLESMEFPPKPYLFSPTMSP
ncbi:putative receptor-like protein kinase [Morus notabilis]|uniref:non-specific serine/threonine protein kinase n=1 Tax=Morus notabilis TaxID=981085 RepID=W9S8X1_9ROSA|nr:putative receptor-like protein kinase [Morus notabilis]